MAKPAPERQVRAVALRGVRVDGKPKARGEAFEVGESDLALMASANQAVAAESPEGKALLAETATTATKKAS